jgi:predicted DNA-binding protein (UPF0251 family)
VHLDSNPPARVKTLVQLLVKATSAQRPQEVPASRQTQVRLDQHRADAVAMAYKEGKTMRELANDFGIHRSTVTVILERNGVETRQAGLSDEQTAEACRLYSGGWPLARLAERYEVAEMTVRRYLLLASVVMRSPHERPR